RRDIEKNPIDYGIFPSVPGDFFTPGSHRSFTQRVQCLHLMALDAGMATNMLWVRFRDLA
ncbi:hypothetical protein, partial [Pseudomonas laurylsulfatiphila]|uniref:hypothetical protein n=1 Tax=Pseudomonas laurylsulfatiphila TaxID=2011015 RepID=UPI003D0FF42E